jgi:hypothetical protein
MNFDIAKFKETLLRECEVAIPKIISDLRHENIYSIALYTDGDQWRYIFPTVSTYAGLSEAAAKYKKMEYYAHCSIRELEKDLKWSPCDSPRHSDYASTLPGTANLIDPVCIIMQELYDEKNDDWKKSEELHSTLVEATLEVLDTLDKQGCFAKEIARESIIVNLLNGDQSNEERLARAKRLNPARVYQSYLEEIEFK